MASRLQRIREQQLLSIDFISSVIQVDPNQYKEFENGNRVLDDEKQSIVLRLLGIENSDLNEQRIEEESPIGLARTYKDLTEKDKKELNKLIIFGEEIERSLA
jgi:hypothetical protein